MNRRKNKEVSGNTKLTSFFSFSKTPVQNSVFDVDEVPVESPTITPTNSLQPTLTGDARYTEEEIKVKRNAFSVLCSSAKRLKIEQAVEEEAEQRAKQREADAIQKNFYQHLSGTENRRRELKLDELRDDVQTDDTLPLFETQNAKRRILFGQGSVNANLFIVFCKPTNEEMANNKPFSSGYARILFDKLRKMGIDPELHCWSTYLMKIAPQGIDPAFEEVEGYLPVLMKEIKIIKPKQILCFGDIPVTLALSHFKLRPSMIGPEWDEERHRFNSHGLWVARQLGLMNTAVRFPEAHHVARVCMSSDFKVFMDLKEKPFGLRMQKDWLEQFSQIRHQMFQPPLVFSDPIEDLNAFLEDKGKGNIYDLAAEYGVVFSQASETILPRSRLHSIPKPKNYLEWLGEKPFRFYLHQTRFDRTLNRFTLFGRTEEGFSMVLHARKPLFRCWFHHGSFDRRVDENGKIDYRPPDIDRLQQEVDQQILGQFGPRYRRGGMEDDEILAFCGVKLRYVLKRPYLYFHRERSQYLEVEFSLYKTLSQIKEILFHVLPGCTTYEARIKPEDFIYYDRAVNNYSWIEISKNKLIQWPHETVCDLEFATTYDEVRYVDYEKDAPVRVLNLDGEMKKRENSDALPIPLDSAIVRLCCTLNDLNPVGRVPRYEIRRHPKARADRLANKRKNRETRMTGNTDIIQRMEFVVGPHEMPTAEPWSPTMLPYIPLLPLKPLLEWTEIPSDPFLEGTYGWNQFIDQVHEWIGWVGRIRAERLFNHPHTTACFFEGEIKKISKADQGNKELYNEWKDKIHTLAVTWSMRLPDDAIDAPENQPESHLTTKDEIGTIQFNWPSFYPTPTIRFYDSEATMLVSFAEYVRETDVDLFVGHNICGFDIPFIIRRMQVLDLKWRDYFEDRHDFPVGLNRGSFLTSHEPTADLCTDTIRVKKMETRANGARLLTLIDIPGLMTFDTLHYAQKDVMDLHGFDLSSVAKETVGDVKHDVPHTSINPLFFNNPKKLTDYCLQDTELCDRIVNYRFVGFV